MVEALVSVERIQSYLLEPECPRIDDTLEKLSKPTQSHRLSSQHPQAQSTGQLSGVEQSSRLSRSWTDIGAATIQDDVSEEDGDHAHLESLRVGGGRKAVGIVVDRASFIWDGALRIRSGTTATGPKKPDGDQDEGNDNSDDEISDDEVDPEFAPWRMASYLPLADSDASSKVTNRQKITRVVVQSLVSFRNQVVQALQFTTPASSRGELSRAPSLSAMNSSPAANAPTANGAKAPKKDAAAMLSEVEITKYITAALLREQELEVRRLNEANRVLTRQLQQVKRQCDP